MCLLIDLCPLICLQCSVYQQRWNGTVATEGWVLHAEAGTGACLCWCYQARTVSDGGFACKCKLQQQQQQPFYNPLSVTTRVSRYQQKHSPTHHPDHHPNISLFHQPRSVACYLFKLRAWQSFCTTSVHVLFGLPLGLGPSTSYSIHFFTQSLSSFRNTCPYHRNLFCCSINIVSSNPCLSLNSTQNSIFYLCSLECHLILVSWQARSHFHVAYYFAHSCYTASLS